MAFVTTVSSSSKGSLPLLISYSPRSFKKIPPFYTYIHVADAFFGIKCTNMLVQTPVYMKKFPNQNISSKNRRIHILFFQVHMLGHKTSLSKFKKTKITSSRFSGQEGMELEIKCKKQVLEKHKHVENGSTKKIKEEIKKNTETNENGNTRVQNLWDAAKEAHRDTGLLQEKSKKSQII